MALKLQEDNSSIFGPLPESFRSYAAWGYNFSGPWSAEKPLVDHSRPLRHAATRPKGHGMELVVGPVLQKVPASPHAYISHAYIRPSSHWHQPLVAFFCFKGLTRRCRRLRPRLRAQEDESIWLEKFRKACQLRRFDVIARIAHSLKDEGSADELLHGLSFECLRRRPEFFKSVMQVGSPI